MCHVACANERGMRTWHVHLYLDSVDGIQFRTYKKMLSKKTSTISSPWDILTAHSSDVLIVSFLCYNDYKAAKEVSLRFVPRNLFETINIEENAQVTVDQMMNFFEKTTHYKTISFFNNPVVNDDVIDLILRTSTKLEKLCLQYCENIAYMPTVGDFYTRTLTEDFELVFEKPQRKPLRVLLHGNIHLFQYEHYPVLNQYAVLTLFMSCIVHFKHKFGCRDASRFCVNQFMYVEMFVVSFFIDDCQLISSKPEQFFNEEENVWLYVWKHRNGNTMNITVVRNEQVWKINDIIFTNARDQELTIMILPLGI